ncbi:MAG: hypothetical protein V4707_05495 [Pseudomonadota bacterium]
MRQREFIDKRQHGQLAPSIRFAAEIGLPINTFTTIQFGATACEPERVGPAFRNLIRNRFTPWLRPTKSRPIDYRPAAWIYWIENVHEYEHHPHGTHVHWAAHIPPERRAAFEIKLPEWVVAVGGTIFDSNVAIQVKDADNPRGLPLYIGKGLKPQDAKKRRIRPSPQGVVHGRRLSISEAINISAINAHRDRLRAAAGPKSLVEQASPFGWPANDYEKQLNIAPWD